MRGGFKGSRERLKDEKKTGHRLSKVFEVFICRLRPCLQVGNRLVSEETNNPLKPYPFLKAKQEKDRTRRVYAAPLQATALSAEGYGGKQKQRDGPACLTKGIGYNVW
jgi:hypothetical protein